VYRAVFAASLILGHVLAGQAAGPRPVGFDWFDYRGQDPEFAAPLQPGHYRNPILAGFHPDPSVVRVGADYYLVNSSFAWFPGLPVYHSRDLVHWRQIGSAFDRRSQLRLENGQGISRGIFAPTIRYHGGIFYIITTDVDGIGNFYVTAQDPAGPWSDPVILPEIDGIDPDLFFDGDGRAYIVHNGPPPGSPLYEGHRAIWLWEFDPERRRVVAGSGHVIVNGGTHLSRQPVWIEGPHLYRVGGWYYLLCAEGGTEEGHSEVAFRSRSLAGPFVPDPGNPILTQRDLDPARPDPVTSTGHADLVQTHSGDWWAVFLGVRPYAGRYHNTGRETFLLPVTWRDGWPVILESDTPVPWQAARPELPGPEDDIPLQTGNFDWRDDFDQVRLGPEWLRARTSPLDWYHLDAAAGMVYLDALPLTLRDRAQPAFLARRVQHRDFRAATRLEMPAAPGVAAGLAAFQSSDFHFFLGVRRKGDACQVFLEEVVEGTPEVRVSAGIAAGAGHIVLGMQQQGDSLTFTYASTPGEPVTLASGVDARLLSTQVAGGFVGAMVGIHARRE